MQKGVFLERLAPGSTWKVEFQECSQHSLVRLAHHAETICINNCDLYETSYFLLEG